MTTAEAQLNLLRTTAKEYGVNSPLFRAQWTFLVNMTSPIPEDGEAFLSTPDEEIHQILKSYRPPAPPRPTLSPGQSGNAMQAVREATLRPAEPTTMAGPNAFAAAVHEVEETRDPNVITRRDVPNVVIGGECLIGCDEGVIHLTSANIRTINIPVTLEVELTKRVYVSHTDTKDVSTRINLTDSEVEQVLRNMAGNYYDSPDEFENDLYSTIKDVIQSGPTVFRDRVIAGADVSYDDFDFSFSVYDDDSEIMDDEDYSDYNIESVYVEEVDGLDSYEFGAVHNPELRRDQLPQFFPNPE